MSALAYLQAEILRSKDLNLAHPGRMRSVLEALDPEDRARLIEGANVYDHEVAMGRHGSREKACEELEVDPTVARRVHDGLQVEYVCHQLQARKSDADLPPPPLTRRDVLSAAFDAHTQE